MAKGIIYVMTTVVPGLIKIGKPNFSQMIICKLSDDGEWVGQVREKEGLY